VGSSRSFLLFLVIAVLILLPFFEGVETSLGLFLVHSLTLAAFALCCLITSRISIPKFIIAFLPFFAVLVVSTVISPYKFASFLKLWDYFGAGTWAILICTLIQTDRGKIQTLAPWLFVVTTCSTITAILIYNTNQLMRISASFLNPNDLRPMHFCFFVSASTVSKEKKIAFEKPY
jgi:hypothetical protein